MSSLAQALSRLSRLLTAIDGSLPAAKIVSPTLEFLQGVGHASDNPVIKWVLSRCHTWCAAEHPNIWIPVPIWPCLCRAVCNLRTGTTEPIYGLFEALRQVLVLVNMTHFG